MKVQAELAKWERWVAVCDYRPVQAQVLLQERRSAPVVWLSDLRVVRLCPTMTVFQ